MRVIDDRFQEAAFALGYHPSDLLPIEQDQVEQESEALLKGMT